MKSEESEEKVDQTDKDEKLGECLRPLLHCVLLRSIDGTAHPTKATFAQSAGSNINTLKTMYKLDKAQEITRSFSLHTKGFDVRKWQNLCLSTGDDGMTFQDSF